ncbi:histidinol dehydrogenase [Melioribacteraceae bacterium 4301-Me]|uniref:histidinol dehydrogenase n=1 Tax=Pyranulibacter aquaticus TaxID=3163344 RepID=UPI0035963890
MKIYTYNKTSNQTIERLFSRTAINNERAIKTVKPILEDIKQKGNKALIKYAKKYDGLRGKNFLVPRNTIINAAKKIDKELKEAIDTAANNIYNFHKYQKPNGYSIETTKGIKCKKIFLPIENVGLYIPGGSAELFSTLLMLGIPAKIAGCKRVIVTSKLNDNKISPQMAYAALKCNITEFYNIGGAQAIGMMAYGTESIKKVDKIFGPGNQYVTAAKSLVSIDSSGCTIDMLAGPSELLIIADKFANAAHVAADLLSQAEHGADSQVILITDDFNLARQVKDEMEKQVSSLPRRKIITESLKSSFILVVTKIEDAVTLSNIYAPEHLILNFKNAKRLINKIKNAGSVFIGRYSTESIGDYASGTNHSLPTMGYSKSVGGVSVESFMKGITFQEVSKEGFKKISRTVIKMAEEEKLNAHANAVKIRMAKWT